MSDRRSFLKQAGLLSGATFFSSAFPDIIQKAMAISPNPGTTFYDAEHIVFLMQENRSFDHMFGTLKGVRGFNDPRPYILPNKDKVWLQRDDKGNAYTPFHIDLNKTKVTWQGGLAHSWPDQIAAFNKGKYNKWVPVKSNMALAYYKREDLPFYYALADAFTICDHYFCSSLTGTTPNRLFFWTGNVRPHPDKQEKRAVVNNNQAESHTNTFVDFPTFPELLEKHNVSWRVYQNEIWTAKLKGELDDWCGNYGDNALEYVTKHNVNLASYFRKNGNKNLKPPKSAEEILAQYNQLSQTEKNLIDKSFTTNEKANDYLDLAPFTFKNDKGEEEKLNVPKGDIFYQFRKDVDEGKLPTISWLVAPQRFSDHTSSPLYGTWYVSEALNILIKDPEVWKKTIFIVNYDENDGYFDHIPPFVVPKPNSPESGKVSKGIDVTSDFDVQDDSPIGLGYRVPMIVASPWSKGGFVNSQIFDHTSTLMFLENFLNKKNGIKIQSEQISTWRRAICGDMSSIFRPYEGEKPNSPKTLKRDEVIQHIQEVKFKPRQQRPHPLSEEAIKLINQHHTSDKKVAPYVAQQENGTKPACKIPYELFVDSKFDKNKKSINLDFKTGLNSVGSPFKVNALRTYSKVAGANWNFAVSANSQLNYEWLIKEFENHQYDIAVHGPNGFYRRYAGNEHDPDLKVNVKYSTKHELVIELINNGKKKLKIKLTDDNYKTKTKQIDLAALSKKDLIISFEKSYNWYNIQLNVFGFEKFLIQCAGHIENTSKNRTDPYMGNQIV